MKKTTVFLSRRILVKLALMGQIMAAMAWRELKQQLKKSKNY